MSVWPIVKLGDVLNLDLYRVAVDAGTSYPMVGVLSFGKGLFEREPIENGKTSYKYFLRLKNDHVVMSQLFGWEGALALSSDKFAGKFLSPQFPTFVVDHERLDRVFLGWVIRQPSFWENLGTRTSGMGDRRRTLNPAALFDCEIPLPPLEEQRRVVARIEEVAGHINEAQMLRKQVSEEVEAFIVSLHINLSKDRNSKLSELLALHEDPVTIKTDGSYPQVGVKGFGAGLFAKPPLGGMDTTYRFFNRLYDGALVLSQVKGWEGAIAVCPAKFTGWFASPEYRTFQCKVGKLSPGYLSHIVRTNWFWGRLSGATRGVGARRERTRPEQFLELEVPFPPFPVQQKAEEIFSNVKSLKQTQAESDIALDALMPSILARAFRGELT